ncbi:MAG: serpin family protein [Chlamydiota bacterium]
MRLSSVPFLLLFCLLKAISSLKAQENGNNLADNLNQTGMLLYYIIDKPCNTIISPFSINSSLLMAYMGAEGKTAEEMKQALRLTMPRGQVGEAYRNMRDRLGKGVEVGVSAWVEKDTPILSSYETVIREDFKGSIEKVDFIKSRSAASTMDRWLHNDSQGNVSRFIDPATLTQSTKMILLNTFSIKGFWSHPFPTQRSGAGRFKTVNGQLVNCRMMNQKSSLGYFENKETQIVALPLEGLNSHISFIVFLPKEKHSHLYDFYYSQDESAPKGFLSYLNRFEQKDVDLTLPKFTVSQKLDLKDFFKILGIHSAFDTNGNFSRIDGKQNLYISQAFHKSILSIDEGGIFVATGASTPFSLKTLPEPKNPIVMHVNRPFLYAIYDFDTNLLLLLGQCLNPSVDEEST